MSILRSFPRPGHRNQSQNAGVSGIDVTTMPRDRYVALFGPTSGDDEAVFGGSQVIRESMGQSSATRAEGTPGLPVPGSRRCALLTTEDAAILKRKAVLPTERTSACRPAAARARVEVVHDGARLTVRATPGGVHLLGSAAGPNGGDELRVDVVVGRVSWLTWPRRRMPRGRGGGI